MIDSNNAKQENILKMESSAKTGKTAIRRNCLNCKYEPDWSEGGLLSDRKLGACKWDKELPNLPSIMGLLVNRVVRFRDGTGMPEKCKAWEPKTV